MSLSRLLRAAAFAALAGVSFAAAAKTAVPVSAAPLKVLIVVSGEGRDQGKSRPGFEMDEFAQAWSIFVDNGFAIDVASPRGGAVEAPPSTRG